MHDKIRNFLNRFIYLISSILIVLMVIDVSWQVISRYFLNNPASFTDECARFLMIWLALLGGALLFGKNGHIAITMVIDKFSPKYKFCIQLIIYVSIALFALFALTYGGYNLIIRTLRQPSPAMGIPMGYVYSILPLSGVLIIIYSYLNIQSLITNSKSK